MSNVRLRPGFTMVEWIVVLVVDVILIGVMLPATAKINEAAGRAKTQNNLKMMGLALNNFDSAYNLLPHNQGISSGTSTRPALFHILPFMEHDNYYHLYLTTQPASYPIAYYMDPARGGPGYIPENGATTDYAVNGAIFGDISTASPITVNFVAGFPPNLTIPPRHTSVTNCTTYSISTLVSARGTSSIIFAGQKRMAVDGYETRAGDMGINATATTTTAATNYGGRGTPHAITSIYVDKDPEGSASVYGDWGCAFKVRTTFLFGDGHTATLRNTISGTFPFADAINPNSNSTTVLE